MPEMLNGYRIGDRVRASAPPGTDPRHCSGRVISVGELEVRVEFDDGTRRFCRTRDLVHLVPLPAADSEDWN